MKKLIQVGFYALRKPNGEILEPHPLMIEATPELEEKHKQLFDDLNEIKAHCLVQYINALKETKKGEKQQ